MRTALAVMTMVLFMAGCKSDPPPPAAPEPTIYINGSNIPIWIMGKRWFIQVGRRDELLNMLSLYGLTDCRTRYITVLGNLNFMNQRNVIAHEVLHAATCDETGNVHNKYFNSSSDEDHEGFYKISDFYITLLHDNPELGKYLTQ